MEVFLKILQPAIVEELGLTTQSKGVYRCKGQNGFIMYYPSTSKWQYW